MATEVAETDEYFKLGEQGGAAHEPGARQREEVMGRALAFARLNAKVQL